MNNKHFLGKRISSFEVYDTVGPITGVALLIDDNNEIVAGTDDGYVMEIECPYGTQTMANNLLSSLQGKSYHGYRSEAAELIPEAELGDGITVNNLYSMLAYRSVAFGGGHLSEIAAPGESELEHEYPYVSQEQRQIERKIAITRSMITKTAEEIRLEVSQQISGLSSSISVQLESITSTVQGIDGRVSTVEQTASGLTSTVQGINGEISTIEQTLEGVAFKSSLADGTTTINGGCITTGQILASYIKLGGYMDLYESLSSNTISGRFGRTTVSVDGSSYNVLGFTSLSNVYIGGDGKGFIVTNDSLEAYVSGNIKLRCMDKSYQSVLTYGYSLCFNDVAVAYVSSDRKLKSDIDYDVNEKLVKAFDGLKPVFFHMIGRDSDKDHVGFIAQDVVESIEAAGLGNALTAVDCNGNYALNYGEITALLTAKIKQIEKRLEVLGA